MPSVRRSVHSSSHFGGDILKAVLQTPEMAEKAFVVQALACLRGSGTAKMRTAVVSGVMVAFPVALRHL